MCIRDSTALGWISALVCYQPFWSLISRQYIDYDTGLSWGVWFHDIPWLYDLWGCLILFTVVVYVWATIAFGARFSNLTHRGIITNGPYRYTKMCIRDRPTASPGTMRPSAGRCCG